MIFFLILLVALLFYGMQVAPKGQFFDNYCGIKQTSTINGIFTILIFVSHSCQYVDMGGVYDDPYLSFRKYIGQLVVASFLLYSGFGMMESIKKKGFDYIKGFPKNRLFKTWYHFALMLIPFVILNFVFDEGYTTKNILLSFTGYRAVGNSNWYMFITFCMYIIIFVAFFICRKHKLLGVALTFALAIGFAYFESKIGLEQRYYNTLFCMPFGMLFSLIKPYFDKVVCKNELFHLITLAVIFAGYYYFSSNRDDSIVHHNIFAILAVMMIMVINMKIKIGNGILDWFGNHIFSFFILQRIPMITLKQLGFNDHKYSFIIVCFICTIVIATAFDMFTDYTDKLLFKKKAATK